MNSHTSLVTVTPASTSSTSRTCLMVSGGSSGWLVLTTTGRICDGELLSLSQPRSRRWTGVDSGSVGTWLQVSESDQLLATKRPPSTVLVSM